METIFNIKYNKRNKNKVRMKDTFFEGSLEDVYLELSKIYHRYENIDVPRNWIGFPGVYDDIEIEYIGVKSGYKYPPYHLNEKMVGSKFKLWAGSSGCNLGYVDQWGGCNSFPEGYYLFKVDIGSYADSLEHK